MNNKKYLTIVILLLITITISWGFYFNDYQHKDSINIKDFPTTIDQWSSKDLPIDKSDLVILETKNAFLRRYTDDKGRRVYLYIVYSESSPKATNPPEVFYNELGVSIIDKGKKYITIASSDITFKVNWLLLDNDENQQMVYYLYKVGDTYTHSYWKQRALAAFYNVIGKKTGSALIRISTNIVNGQQKEAIDLTNEFACLIIPQLMQRIP